MLRADCPACVGLCCVALAFDCSALFAFDKPAGEACRHLTSAHRCAIHARLTAEGMAGCARYDCLGAGQRATTLFPGRAPDREMFEAFRVLREVHGLLQLLHIAGACSLTQAHRQELDAIERELCATDWRRQTDPIRRARAFLVSLRNHSWSRQGDPSCDQRPGVLDARPAAS